MKVELPRLTGMGIPPGKGARVVAPEMTRKEDPSTEVVLPMSPGGALESGIVVGPEIVMGWPGGGVISVGPDGFPPC